MICSDVDAVLQKYPQAGRDALIPILQAVQEAHGFLSEAAVVAIGRHLDLPASKIYGVATFYNQFRFKPLGTYHIQVCRGTACHVKGSGTVLSALKRALEIDADETTRDGVFSLEVVACIGACGLAPALTVNGEVHAKVDSDAVPGILDSYRRKGDADGSAS